MSTKAENINSEEEELKNTEEQEIASHDVTVETESSQDTSEQEDNAVDPIVQALEQIEELKDQNLRLRAEFENYKKRTMREKAELIQNGGRRVIESILPILDDMELALKNMSTAQDVQAVLEGVEIINKKFIKTLESQGVNKIETEKADFDVELHEAIAQFPAPSEELKGKVIDCTRTGYKLNGTVIRHSQVVVGI